MTPAERLIAQMRAQRMSWVEVAPAANERPAKRVQITRPPENDMSDFISASADGKFTMAADIGHVTKYVVGWDGVTEADLVGPAGSSDAVAFDVTLWRLVVEDKLEWMRVIARALLDAILAHRAAQQDDAKN